MSRLNEIAMNDKTLVERLRDREHHFRHALEGEHDANLFMKARFEIEAQATRIEALEAVLRIEIWNGLKRNGMSDDAATAMVKERMAALESQS